MFLGVKSRGVFFLILNLMSFVEAKVWQKLSHLLLDYFGSGRVSQSEIESYLVIILCFILVLIRKFDG